MYSYLLFVIVDMDFKPIEETQRTFYDNILYYFSTSPATEGNVSIEQINNTNSNESIEQINNTNSIESIESIETKLKTLHAGNKQQKIRCCIVYWPAEGWFKKKDFTYRFRVYRYVNGSNYIYKDYELTRPKKTDNSRILSFYFDKKTCLEILTFIFDKEVKSITANIKLSDGSRKYVSIPKLIVEITKEPAFKSLDFRYIQKDTAKPAFNNTAIDPMSLIGGKQTRYKRAIHKTRHTKHRRVRNRKQCTRKR